MEAELLVATLYSMFTLLHWLRPSHGIFSKFVFCEVTHKANTWCVCARACVQARVCVCGLLNVSALESHGSQKRNLMCSSTKSISYIELWQ